MHITLEVFTPVKMYIVAFLFNWWVRTTRRNILFHFLQFIPGIWLVMKKTEENEPWKERTDRSVPRTAKTDMVALLFPCTANEQ
jgi:hypothetical protein